MHLSVTEWMRIQLRWATQPLVLRWGFEATSIRLARRNTFTFPFQLTLGKVNGLVASTAGVWPVKFI